MSRAGSLLALSNKAAVRRQISYASRLQHPWGISESQYYALDRDQNYQYSGFGVPDLGIKRGLSENTVIAPLCQRSGGDDRASRGTQKSRPAHAHGRPWATMAGTRPSIIPAPDCQKARSDVVIQTYMAHHQGMMILGIANVVHDGAMRERFHAEPMVKAAELLLQERMPRDVAVARLPPEMQTGAITFFDRTPRVPRSLFYATHRRPTHPSTVQWQLQPDADGGRRWL